MATEMVVVEYSDKSSVVRSSVSPGTRHGATLSHGGPAAVEGWGETTAPLMGESGFGMNHCEKKP
jgi:hypothetical protein